MKFSEKVINCIDCKKSIEDQLNTLSQFDNITDEEIEELFKLVKWEEAGILIEYLGFEKLIKYLPQFLEFLQDMNWPAAHGTAKMLVKAERILLPEIRKIFNEHDSLWQDWILCSIIEFWKVDLIFEIKSELIECKHPVWYIF